jgi:hypothetical protein
MNTPRFIVRSILSSLVSFLLALALPIPSSAQQPDKSTVLKNARQTYYSLKAEGFSEFRCNMVPDWAYLLQDQLKGNPDSMDAAIKKFEDLHFLVTLGLDGKAQVMHNDLAAENEQVAAGLKQIYSGMGQMAEGFFQTWTAYMFSPALPEPGVDFQLEQTAAEYRISYKEESSDISTTMSRDYAITSQLVKSPQFEATLKPAFSKIPKGRILSGYQATYRGQTEADATDLSVVIAYQEVGGLQIPQEITLSGSYGGNPFKAKIAFSGCQVTKK